MSVEILQGAGRVNDVGILVISDSFTEQDKAAFWREFFNNTPAGRKIRRYMTTDAARQRSATEADQQVLGDFVQAFTTTPTSVRFIGGFITLNNGKKYSKSTA